MQALEPDPDQDGAGDERPPRSVAVRQRTGGENPHPGDEEGRGERREQPDAS